jgi:outer membrane protein TolC
MPSKEDSEALKELKAPLSSERQWQPPDLRKFGTELTAQKEPEADAQKVYELAELVDLAERINPETKVAWEQAKQAASGIGLAQSDYYPVLALQAAANYDREPIPIPLTATKATFEDLEAQQASPVATLEWVLLDFGRRRANVRAAKYKLLASNLGFNAHHQAIMFRVQSAFFDLSKARGRIDVAQSSLNSAVKVQEATEERFKQGLATATDVSQARQQAVRAAFDIEAVQVEERDAHVSLAEAIGITPTTPFQVEDFSRLPMPANLEDSVGTVIDRSLKQRPDLLAKVAVLREKEAEIRHARASYYPTLSFQGTAGGAFDRARMDVNGQKLPWASTQQPTWGVGLALTWSLFDGGARKRKLEIAKSEHDSAQHELDDSRDKAISQVWRYYSDTKLAIRRLEVAAALVEASQKSYEQTLESYQNGLSSLVDLLAARRELSQSRYTQLDTRTSVLQSAAALAFASGDLGPQRLNRNQKR